MSIAGKPAPFGSDLRAALVAMVRKRVPESEVEDIVQQALTEAIDSPHAPAESEALRRWIFGVAKNKIVDYHRRAGRETFDLPDVAGSPAPHVEADLLRWAERNLPEGAENHKTLDWMLREGEGEKLESIAEDEKLPAPRVRQRVSRLRRHFKENWRREVTLLAALGVIVTALFLVLRKSEPEIITHDNVPDVAPLRRAAFEKCAKAEWKDCIEKLDEARRLDPAGDVVPEVQRARQAAESARQAPSPSSSVQTPPPPSSVQAPGPSAMLAPPLAPSSPTTVAPAPRKQQKSDALDNTPSGKPAAPQSPRGSKRPGEASPVPPAVLGPKS